jgi:type IV secretion system protein VirB10
MEKENAPRWNGPRIAAGNKVSRRFGKRAIFLFIFGVLALILAINLAADFGVRGSNKEREQTIRPPSKAGFAELAADWRRDRGAAKPVRPSPDVGKPQSRVIVIDRRGESAARPAPLTASRYFSNKDDAQAAEQLRTLKLQALAAKPVAGDFERKNEGAETPSRVSGETRTNVGTAAPQIMDATAAAALLAQGQNQAPNGQGRKLDFLRGATGGGSMTPQGYSPNLPLPQQFPYELKAGAIIPAILVTGINSDLPGNIVAQVSENVWDSSSGKFVLIPKGSRILGVYDSEVSFGQRRVLLVWNRVIFPNGTTLDIAGSPGVDQSGYSGLSGRVNEHWGKMFASALVASVFVAGAETLYDSDSNSFNDEDKGPRDLAAESLAGSVLDMGTKIMNKAADLQPTITVRPGKRVGIFVQRDVVFPSPYF